MFESCRAHQPFLSISSSPGQGVGLVSFNCAQFASDPLDNSRTEPPKTRWSFGLVRVSDDGRPAEKDTHLLGVLTKLVRPVLPGAAFQPDRQLDLTAAS